MKILVTVILTIVVLAAAGLVYIYSGLYNVSAAGPEGELQEWVLSTSMDKAVKRHAKSIPVPDLGDSAQIALGYFHFSEMCVGCHGGPGIEPSEVGKGLNPQAPDLSKVVREWNDAELYWIMKNGIKMTGMPSFGKTHSEEALWAMVAFVKKLPEMTPEQYRSYAEAAKPHQVDEQPQESEHRHSH